MFVVSQSGNVCEEFKTIEKEIRTNEKVLEKIRKKQIELELKTGDLPIVLQADIVDLRLTEYAKGLNEDSELLAILINNKEYGIFERNIGEAVFDEIIESLKSNIPVFDMRDYKDLEDRK